MKKMTLFALILFITLIGLFGVLLFGGALFDLTPSKIQTLEEVKNFFSNSVLISYSVMVIMAVYWDKVVDLTFSKEKQRDVMREQKNIIRFFVAAYILLQELLPPLLGMI